ncbi:hypothetical protein BGZ83_003361 [Gryganskiella cystojenkinii]|nr:hypothetical protein BGZ83_003361 [Gryganskiella cystojenkinii]
MSNLYYKKDAHKSIEGLLYALFVYNYLLDTSTFGLLLRCLVQDDTTLRIALYAIVATSFLAFLRHLHAPSKYAVIIDFIGNVSPPSRTKLFFLDLVIMGLQILQALVVSAFLKAGSNGARVAASRNGQQQAPRTITAPSTPPPAGSNSGTSAQTQPSASTSVSIAAPTSESSRTRTGPSGSLSREAGSSSTLFEYTPTHHALDPAEDDARARTTSSEHRSRRHRRRRTSDSQRSGSSSSESTGEEDDDVLADDDFEEMRDQETFVFQLQFRDVVSYLLSNEEPLSFPRLDMSAQRTAPATEADRVQDLPV